MSNINDGRYGVPASSERRAEQLREMKGRLQREESERLAEVERSRLAAIDHDRKWKEHFESHGIDDIIEIPGKQGGKDIILRYHERDGRLIAVEQEILES